MSENKKHPKLERTLVIIKPDGIQRGLMGEIISRYERAGLKLTAMKMTVPTSEMIEKHYTLDPEWRRITGEKTIKGYVDKGLTPPHTDPHKITEILLGRLEKYMTSGPVIVMIWQGAHAVAIVRKLTGGTEPLTSDVGSIRGDFVIDSYQMTDLDGRSVRNLVHASGSPKEAEDEIGHWFGMADKNGGKDGIDPAPAKIIDYTLVQERILYDVNLEGLLG